MGLDKCRSTHVPLLMDHHRVQRLMQYEDIEIRHYNCKIEGYGSTIPGFSPFKLNCIRVWFCVPEIIASLCLQGTV